MSDAPPRITDALQRADLGDPGQRGEVVALVYEELRTLARRHMRRERDDLTLQPTALVHEAFLRLADSHSVKWESRAHFFGIASRLMRQVLVDAARTRSAQRRGGGQRPLTLDAGNDVASEDRPGYDVLGLHEALERLGRLDPELERLVELRFFAGFTLEETADALGVSRRKAAKDWAAARLWLRRELDES